MNLLRRHPIAIALVVLLLATAINPLPLLVDAVAGSEPGDVTLGQPVLYIVLAPLSDTLDALTFFSLGRARWALTVWAVALAAWGAARPGTVRLRVGRALVGPL
ncbi:MAG: hypothetical protein ACRELA_23095, partial [Candidatus Rokuibacteriota bacterium]